MPLQNRVDPFGAIHADAARGLFTGNRGVIHDPATKMLLTRRWTTRAWLICRCEFGDRRRAVMGRNTPSGRAGWTELFFLDEPTALAAGHRPCFFCRRDDANRFRAAWEEGNGVTGIRAKEMDAVLHGERLQGRRKRLHPLPAPVTQLPDGAMVQRDEESFLILQGRALRWSMAGYQRADGAFDSALLLTPPSTLRAFGAGYRPLLHPSAMD